MHCEIAEYALNAGLGVSIEKPVGLNFAEVKELYEAAEAAGIRDKVKIMIGGAPVSNEYCNQIGADCYTSDAASAADAPSPLAVTT